MLSRSLPFVSTRLTARARYFSTGTQSFIGPRHSIYLSNSTNPLFNLSLEDWLFRHAPAEVPLLLIYRDEPCVIIGRNQNPWKEINMSALRRTGVPFVRRRSGGGTVYHDLGNTNFSIHLPRASFDRHATAQIALRAVQSLGVDALVNDRNDICVSKDKISSAYKIVNKRAYHHGTMLISTQLNTLGDLLHSNKDAMITKGVASVRSPVCNLQSFSSSITHDAFANAVVEEFRKEYNIHEETQVVAESDETRNIEYICNGMAELLSWEWAYGQTPEFTYALQNSFAYGDLRANIRSKHGVILSCSFDVGEAIKPSLREQLSRLSKWLEGKRYGFVEDATRDVDGIFKNDQTWAVWQWLRKEMEG